MAACFNGRARILAWAGAIAPTFTVAALRGIFTRLPQQRPYISCEIAPSITLGDRKAYRIGILAQRNKGQTASLTEGMKFVPCGKRETLYHTPAPCHTNLTNAPGAFVRF